MDTKRTNHGVIIPGGTFEITHEEKRSKRIQQAPIPLFCIFWIIIGTLIVIAAFVCLIAWFTYDWTATIRGY